MIGKQLRMQSALKFSIIGSNMQQQQTRVVKCKKLSLGRMKCKIDASFPNYDNRFSIGMCIRDYEGTFVLAKLEWFEPKCDMYIGEALSLLSTLHWIHELHLGPIDFELDSKKVVDNFNFSNHDNTEFRAIINDCKSLFRKLYENSSVELQSGMMKALMSLQKHNGLNPSVMSMLKKRWVYRQHFIGYMSFNYVLLILSLTQRRWLTISIPNNLDNTEFGAIINDCKSLFRQLNENSSVKFVRR